MNKKVKKILFITIIVIVLVGLGYLAVIKNAQNNAKHTIENSLQALKTGKNIEEEINKFTGSNKDKTTDIASNEEFSSKLFRDLNYEIQGSKGNLKEATISIKISNRNAAKIFSVYIEGMLKLSMENSFTNQIISQEELDKKIDEYFKENIKIDDIEIITNNVELKMENKDGKWMIKEESQQNMINAILPGIKELAENMEKNQ